jgi:hypothetical protein
LLKPVKLANLIRRWRLGVSRFEVTQGKKSVRPPSQTIKADSGGMWLHPAYAENLSRMIVVQARLVIHLRLNLKNN